ncbi:MAG: 30S ribosomal protein S17 [Nitrospinae bacterium]|nr:30S ribosomal protein S17 [Nitrospinota bacterium]
MEKKKRGKILRGEVVSDKMDKTVVVRVDRVFQHPIFKKVVRRSTRIKVHDERNECKIGDKIRVVETRPLSKEKRWRFLEMIGRAKEVESNK